MPPPPMAARAKRPAVTTPASTKLDRPGTRSAMAHGPAEMVHARSQLGNTAMTAALDGLPRGARPSAWTAQMMLAGQDLVGNQAVAGAAAISSTVIPTAPAVAPAPPGQKKPEPPKPKPGGTKPKAVPPPAPKPEVKDKPAAERPGKEEKKAEAGPARSPAADPKFQALKKDVNAKKRKVGTSHPPPVAEAGAAQGAAVPPADDQEARGKAAHAENMDAAEPKTFDKKAFADAVKKAIADRAPKNLEQADEFGESGKAEEVKTEVQGKVGEGKDASAKEIADTTAEAPQPAPDAKEVVPMAPDQVPGKPGAPNPNQAAPDALPPSATDMSAGPAQVNDQMAAAQVTEKQLSLENSREPSFDKAVQDKKEMDTHSAEAPGELRAGEAKELKQVKTAAAGKGTAAMTAIHATRVTTGKQVGTGKEGTKSRDEEKRTQVTAILQKVFDQTKCDVEKILSDLDKAVDRQFTDGEKRARDRFTREHEDGMRRYKAERYGGPGGGFLWAKDKLFDLPEEANRIYEGARDNYLVEMDQVITTIAGTVERELNRAKDRIAAGRKELKEAVDKLPKDLQAIGREAVSDFEGKFDELKDTVNDKGTELVDTLATKYTEAVKSVDAEIAKEKEKNKGLVTKAAEAIGDVIETIKELGRMLMNVLRKAASAIGLILRDPIGFLGNLVTGVGGGLKLFMKNAGRHLQQGVLAWLLGTGASVGLELPKTFDILGILTLIAALLGISWANIRSRLVRRVPEKAVVAAETAVPLVSQVKRRGVAGMWDDLKSRVGDLKKNLISNLVSYLLPTIIIAGVTWIVSLFNPASAFIRACKMIIDIIRFIVTNARQIFEFVNAVLDAVIAIARGGTGGVPALIERALVRAIPVLIGLLAALLGIGGIAGKVKQIFQKIARPVNRAIDAVTKKMADLVKKLWNKLKSKFRKKPDRKPARDKRRPDHQKTPTGKDALLKRATAAIKPKLAAALRAGISSAQLKRRLKAWRRQYKLTDLRLGAGGSFVAKVNPEMVLDDPKGVKIDLEVLGRVMREVFHDAEQTYVKTLRITSVDAQGRPLIEKAKEDIENERAKSLSGLTRMEQQEALRHAEPGSATGRTGRDAHIYADTGPEQTIRLPKNREWISDPLLGTVIGELKGLSPSAYPKMAQSAIDMGKRLGATEREINQAIADGGPRAIDQLVARLAAAAGNQTKTKKLALDRYAAKLKRISLLAHAIEPARKRGIPTATALSSVMLGMGESSLSDFLAGKHAPMAEKGAASFAKDPRKLPVAERADRYTTYAERAKILRDQRVGQIIDDFIAAAKAAASGNRPFISATGYNLEPLVQAIKGWIREHLAGVGDASTQAAASQKLRSQLVAFLGDYDGKTR
ncbi:hypothetical protein [Actinophytocola sp.]|uniref:hypothetical protein n=1 Tax=Actinophytocola sp. TaxID=1872138 RepID=UPI002ED5BE00